MCPGLGSDVAEERARQALGAYFFFRRAAGGGNLGARWYFSAEMGRNILGGKGEQKIPLMVYVQCSRKGREWGQGGAGTGEGGILADSGTVAYLNIGDSMGVAAWICIVRILKRPLAVRTTGRLFHGGAAVGSNGSKNTGVLCGYREGTRTGSGPS